MNDALDADRYFDPEAETAPRDVLEATQVEALRELLAHAYERTALYRELWDAAGVDIAGIDSLEAFHEQVPFISKDVVREYRDRHGDPFGGLLTVPMDELTAINSTSGTTGDPTLVGETWGSGGQASKGGSTLTRDFWELGVRPGDTVGLMLFTYRGPIYLFPGTIGATAMVFDHAAADVPHLLEWSRQYRPTLLYNMSTATLMAVEEAAAAGVDVRDAFASYHAVIWAGEPIGPLAAERARDLGIPLYFQSSAGDVGASNQCRERDGYHVWEDFGHYECIDPETGAQVADGEVGELVASNLWPGPMPLIRHRSDDLVRVTRERCACGRTHLRLFPLGRRGDEVIVRGRRMLPMDVWGAIESVEATRIGLFQVVRTAREVDVLALRVGYAGDPDLAALERTVVATVAEHCEIDVSVELVPNEALLRLGPPHKIPRVTRS